MSVHHQAAAGFAAGADAYERGRPGYPPEAVAWVVGALEVDGRSTVVDLASGTGKLTAPLLPTGAQVVAVEPVGPMRARLTVAVPGAEVVAGTAEALPLGPATIDAITVGQAFHWFRAGDALAEAARVLRRGGGLAVLRNQRDESVPWVAELSRLIGWHRREVPRFSEPGLAGAVDATGAFTSLRRRRFDHAQELDTETLVDRVASVSFVAVLEEGERADLLARVRRLARGLPDRFTLPYRAHVVWCRRR
ncbi:MAG: class I SAM-dependent methyltransferase [Acidimicrobiales bacterium]